MAYYTIAHFLHRDIYGKESIVDAEDLTEAAFDYIFLGKEDGLSEVKISRSALDEMRDSFTYWYPMDLRVSAKDLIKNHLTMSLYNHAFVFQDSKLMPRSYFCNGYININGEKMSKNNGNFITISSLQGSGIDVSRITIAESGDTLTDANFIFEIQAKHVHRLTSLENFLKIVINEYWSKSTPKIVADPVLETTFDRIFDNNINYVLIHSKEFYEKMKFREVVRLVFYRMVNIKDEYVQYNEDDFNRLNPSLLVKFFRVLLTSLNPIAPHWTEYMYETYLNPIYEANGLDNLILTKCLAFERYPEATAPIDSNMFKYNNILKKIITEINETKLKVKDYEKGFAVKAYFKESYSEEQHMVFEMLREGFDSENNNITVDYKTVIREKTNASDKNKATELLKFASYLAKEAEEFGIDILSTEIVKSDKAIIEENMDFLKKMTKCNNIEVIEFNDTIKIKSLKRYVLPGAPFVVCDKI